MQADVYNKMYNPKGRYQAAEYHFPFSDGYFDFVFLTSVFTHMFPADVTNYLSEISRVLRSGGRCFATFFIMNGESRELISLGASTITFPYAGKGYLAYDRDVHEGAVAYEEPWVRQMHEKNGLRVPGPVYYGSWCGRKEFTSYQDIVVSEKIARTAT
jgi:SAM-dependent methyltransferase